MYVPRNLFIINQSLSDQGCGRIVFCSLVVGNRYLGHLSRLESLYQYTQGVGSYGIQKGVTVPIQTVDQTQWFMLEVDVVTIGRPYLLRVRQVDLTT
jgi:hypothetical protein